MPCREARSAWRPRRRRVAGVTLFALAVGALAATVSAAAGPARPAAPAAEHDDGLRGVTGPLRVRGNFLLDLGVLAFRPPPTELLDAGRWHLEAALSGANSFTRSQSVQVALERRSGRRPLDLEFFRRVADDSIRMEPLFLVDGELEELLVSARRGLPGGFEIEVSLPYLRSAGGVLDGLAEEFHSLLSLDQDGRDAVPRDRRLIFLQAAVGEVFVQGSSSGLGDLVLAGRKRLRQRPLGFGLTAELAVKAPVGDERALFSSGSVDFGGQVTASRCRRRHCIHAGVGLRQLGEWPMLGIASQTLYDGHIGYERALGPRTRGVAQLALAQSPLGDLRLLDLGLDTYQVSLGLKRSLGGGRSLTLGLTENVIHLENGPDIAFHLVLGQGL